MPAARSVRLGDWLDQWTARRTASPKTIRNEINLRKNHFKSLAGIPLDKLTTGVIKRWLTGIDQAARKAKPGVGHPHVLRLCYALLSSALTDAVDDGLIASSPMHGVKRPATPKAPLKYLDDEQLAKFLAIDFGPRTDPRRVAVMMLLWLGLRRGEALGLTWGDVDLESGEIRISKQLGRITREGQTKTVLARLPLKTDSSMRVLPASHELLASLREMHGSLPSTPRKQDFVVSLCSGDPIDPDAFSLWLRRLAKSNGVTASPHRLRHTAATMMLNRVGPLEQVAAFLGHADIRTTSVYARITPDTRQQAAHALGQIFDEALASHGREADDVTELVVRIDTMDS
jgi:integrase